MTAIMIVPAAVTVVALDHDSANNDDTEFVLLKNVKSALNFKEGKN